MVLRLLLSVAALASFGPQPALGQAAPWSPRTLQRAAAWTELMNDPMVTAGPSGLRVAIAPGRKWAIAATKGVILPVRSAGAILRVSELHGARWLVRLYGRLRGAEKPVTVGLCEGRSDTGEVRIDLDPRMVGEPPREGVMLQFGVEGEPGGMALLSHLSFLPAAHAPATVAVPGQRSIHAVDLMPNLPRPYRMLDWAGIARKYDRLVFDTDARGEHRPLCWIEPSGTNTGKPSFGLSSYVGDGRAGTDSHEGVTCIGALMGAVTVGIDKRKGPHDFVAMCQDHFNSANGVNLVLNSVSQGTGGSFWYEMWPHMAFYALADRYPGDRELERILRITADRWEGVAQALSPGGRPSFDHTSYDVIARRPVDNGQWREPDAAAGMAWIQYAAYRRLRDPRYLKAADLSMRFLAERRDNPFYEVLLPWGALTAARMNAELGRTYPVDKLIQWSFGISDCRGGWGVIVGNWSGYDCSGLVGSVDNRGGYAFAMNTFAQVGALTPIARYDTRYAGAIGKWALNAANAARLFYPRQLPQGHESSAGWKGDPQGVIAYEGLRYEWEGKRPYATGDPQAMSWGPKTDLGLYGSSYVGLLGGIVGRTSDPAILKLDLLATDFFHAPAHPTHLLYNPRSHAVSVRFDLPPGRRDLYDAVSRKFVARRVSGKARVTLPAGRAMVLVACPAPARITRSQGRTLAGGVVIDFGPQP
jgi:hypothetical protein